MVKKENILVTGSAGQLGKSIKKISSKFYSFNFFFTEKNELDISNFNLVKDFLTSNKISVVINCAAYTDVDKAENNFELANLVNHLCVANLGILCKRFNIKLIHISTDFVFDGENKLPYTENIKPNPINDYGKTKLMGENKILSLNLRNSIILRTSWLYSEFDTNFVKKIYENMNSNNSISVVDDQIGSPTYARHLSEAILNIIPVISNIKTEIYHFANLGYCSKFDFAHFIIKKINKEIQIKKIKTSSIVKRPRFSVLNSKKFQEKFNYKILKWETSFNNFLNNNSINEI